MVCTEVAAIRVEHGSMPTTAALICIGQRCPEHGLICDVSRPLHLYALLLLALSGNLLRCNRFARAVGNPYDCWSGNIVENRRRQRSRQLGQAEALLARERGPATDICKRASDDGSPISIEKLLLSSRIGEVTTEPDVLLEACCTRDVSRLTACHN